MKWVKFHDLKPEDQLDFSFSAAFDPHAGFERGLDPFFQALETFADGWMPDIVKGKKHRKYSRANLCMALKERRDENSTAIGLYRTQVPALDMMLHLSVLRAGLEAGLSLQPLSLFSEPVRCRKFVDMVRAWASHYPVSYAHANSSAEDGFANAPYFGRDVEAARRDGFDKIYALRWLNVFGPKLVDTVGRERMLATPAYQVEALPHGAILLVTWPTAADFATDEARQAQARAWVHLRPELDFDTVLRTLRERSARLVPVEPHFHPDVAPLLSRVVDMASISERQSRIAELNAYRPPEPEEWLPLEAALPSDVADLKAAVEHYALLGEHLVALLHTPVPSVFEQTPESLTQVDARLWSENFPETFERHNIDARAVPAVGGYLGEVLVRRLGGHWIPRKKLEEAQVRVGQRVWLPFARAHRYMRSRQSLLDYSLTQLYRAAEHHRG